MENLTGLGRLPPPDRSKDLDYPMRALLRAATQPTSKYWYSPTPAFDQGATSQCVAYSGVRWLAASPVRNKILPFAPLYKECQRNDEWEGEDYDGTSVRALFRVLKQKGYLESYRWAFDAETVMEAVLTIGPVVMGTAWKRDMFMPDRNGFITPTGRDDGGHAWLIDGGNVMMRCPDGSKGAARLYNSWGKGWGNNGRAWISMKDLQILIDEYGEAGIGVEKKLT